MSVADSVLGQTSVGGLEFLFYLPIGLSTKATSLSLHPVHDFHLYGKLERISGVILIIIMSLNVSSCP